MDPCGIKHGRVTIELARSVNCSPPVDRDGEVTWLTGGATWGVGCRAVVEYGDVGKCDGECVAGRDEIADGER